MNPAQRTALRKIGTHSLHFGSVILSLFGWIAVLLWGGNLLVELVFSRHLPASSSVLFVLILAAVTFAGTVVYFRTGKALKQLEAESQEREV